MAAVCRVSFQLYTTSLCRIICPKRAVHCYNYGLNDIRHTIQRGLDSVLGDEESSSVDVVPLSLKYCDAHKNTPFSEAAVGYDDEMQVDPNHDELIYITGSDLFPDSKYILTDFVNGRDIDLPKEKKQNILNTIQSLHHFVTDAEQDSDGSQVRSNHAHCLRKSVTHESQVQFLLAEHLFSKLVPDGQYILNSIGWENGPTGCYCPCRKCQKWSQPSAFAMGHSEAWHGHPDILVSSYNLPVSIPRTRELDLEMFPDLEGQCYSGHGCPDCFEVENRKELFSPMVYQQAVATAIVNSFVMRKYLGLTEFFVPCFISTQTETGVYFYNCDSDILLKTLDRLDILMKRKLNFKTVFFLWLCLNCFTYQPKLQQTEMNWLKNNGGGANFHKLVGDRLSVYRDDLVLVIGDRIVSSESCRFETATRKLLYKVRRSRLMKKVEMQ